ncbi:dienelactone hydrolase family protein [Hortaea werneckii]|nr:dienelactone hydrolase family protein [Hortaea werneckii]
MSLKTCCASGSLHTGIPTGRIKKMHGLDCYVADAPDGRTPKGVVIIIPDAFGWMLPNNRILADQYAKRTGAHVFLPDFMNGYVMPADMMDSFKALGKTGLWNQLAKVGHILYMIRHFIPFQWYCSPSTASPRISDFFKSVRANVASDLPIGTAGFCWGAKFVTELCWNQTKTDDGKRLIDCGFIAHPSFLKYPDDIEKVVLPLSCAAAEHDMQMSADNAQQTKEVLTAKTAKTKDDGFEHEFVMYDGAEHGFAVRADENEKHQAEQGKKAEDQAVNWFSRWFAHPPPAA